MNTNTHKAQDPALSAGTAKPLFLTRAQHDALLRADQPLLRSAFNECQGKAWTLEGVELHAVSLETAERIAAVLAPEKKWFRVFDANTLAHICDVTGTDAETIEDPRIGGNGEIIVQPLEKGAAK